ncbi:MAG: HIT domain-containing protein [Candidatus Choladocola sp.]|nr:HIT domain-containing protein [Candidatus Choladocola sp.]
MYRCIFCQMLTGKVKNQKVYEDDSLYAYLDPNPWGPVHIVLFPKTHTGIGDSKRKEYQILKQKMLDNVPTIAQLGGCDSDYQLYTEEGEEHRTQNEEHLHFHIVGKRSE